METGHHRGGGEEVEFFSFVAQSLERVNQAWKPSISFPLELLTYQSRVKNNSQVFQMEPLNTHYYDSHYTECF